MKNILLIVSLALFIRTAGFCQDVPAKLDQFFTSLNTYEKINGNVLIAENGNIVYKKSFGFADLENNRPNSDAAQFTLASVSKVFTSAAILQLRDKGRLKLDDQVVKYFEEFPYPGITIRNLLSHTSGLPDYQLYEEQIDSNPDKIFSNKEILPSLKMWKKPLISKPGEEWNYSNTNFCLLALLVEKLSGLEFRQYVHTYIFKPANMENTYFQGDPNRSGEKNKAINYEYPFLYSRTFQNVDSMKKYRWRLYNVSGFVGQGNVVSTTADMLKFDHALYSGKIVKAATLEEAFTPTKLNNGMNADADIGIGKASYGLGWFIFDDTSEGKIVWHTGGQPGGLSILVRNVTKKQFIMMFDNAFHKNLYADARNAMAILNNKQFVFHKKSLTRDYGSSLVAEGVDVSFCKLQQLRADSAHYYVSEDEMNELGLRLLYEATFDGHKTLALEVLKLNTLLFPSGYNTYDSYGEALSNVGKRDAAIVMYEKSIEINPKNEGGRKALEKLLKH